MVAASAGRKGRRWRRARAQTLATSTICILCGHDGAGDAHHHPVPLKQLIAQGLDPDDAQHLAPAHGASSRCPTCGRCCNQVQSDKPYKARPPASRAW